MTKTKKILIPVAFTNFSKGIIDYAVNMARSLEAELIFINVINERDVAAVQTITSFGYEVDEAHYIKEVEKQRIQLLKELLNDIDYPEDKMRFVFKVGRPATALLKYAVKEDVDLIIMGVKAKTDLVHTFTGSVAEKMFRYSPIPIVSYRSRPIAEKLRKRIETL